MILVLFGAVGTKDAAEGPFGGAEGTEEAAFGSVAFAAEDGGYGVRIADGAGGG